MHHAFVWPVDVSAPLGNPVRRLKTRPQFQAVLAGNTIAKTTHFALHRCRLSPGGLITGAVQAPPLFSGGGVWLGAMVPKRWAKRAVTRNAIKRQIYGVSQSFELSLAEQAHVVRLRATFDRSEFLSAASDVLKTAVREELKQLFSRALAT